MSANHTPPANRDEALDELAAEGQRLGLYDNTPPAPALPQEVNGAIYTAARKINWRLNTTHYVDIAGIIKEEVAAVLAPVVAELAEAKGDAARRKAQVDLWASAAMDGNAAIAKAVARAEAAERKLEEMTGWRNECGFRYNQAKAERDELRAEFEKLTIVAAQTADRNTALRAEVERLTEENKGLRAGKPIGAVVGAMTIIEQDKTITDLRAQLAAAMQDKERLDWLERCTSVTWNTEPPRYIYSPGALPVHSSVRAAIDAARREGGGHD